MRREFGLAAISIALGITNGDALGQEQSGARSDGPSFPVAIRVDATSVRGEMRPVWRYFGYDEPNYTYMKDGKKLLSQLSVARARDGLTCAPTTC